MATSSESTRALARDAALAQQRDEVVARSSRCDHAVITESEPRAYGGPVAEARRGSEYNPAAHGNIEVIETCSRCSATRRVLINQIHREVSGWHADTDEVDSQLADSWTRLRRSNDLDRIEAGAWRGNTLEVAGAASVLVEIATYVDDDRHINLGLNGERRCYSIDEIEDTATNRRLDDAQRTAWALIARRARRALAGRRAHGVA